MKMSATFMSRKHIAQSAIDLISKTSMLQNGDYDPYAYGDRAHAIGYWGASAHLVRTAIGAGILAMPFAFARVGYGAGCATLAAVLLLYAHSVRTLLRVEYALCRRLRLPSLAFVAVVERAFDAAPRPVRNLLPGVKWLLYAYWALPSANAVCLLAIGQNVRQLLAGCARREYSLREGVAAALAPAMALCLVLRLPLLVPLSVLASTLTFVSLTLLVCVLAWNGTEWPVNVQAVEDVGQVPKFVATALQSLAVAGMVIPLKDEMRNPRQLTAPLGVLNVSYVLVGLLVSAFGLLGYLNGGGVVRDNILANLSDEQPCSRIVLVLYTISLGVTYALVFCVSYDTIWRNGLATKLVDTGFENAGKHCARVAINVAAFGMAVAIPNLGVFVAIVGTVGILVEIGLPAALQLLVSEDEGGVRNDALTRRFLVCKNVAIVAFSAVTFAMSLKTCVVDVMDIYARR